MNNIQTGIDLRLRLICDGEEKATARTAEYKTYLIARCHKPSLVDKQYNKVPK